MRRLLLGIAVATTLSLVALREGQTQILILEPPSGELTLGYDGIWSSTPATPTSTNQTLRESLAIRLGGAVYSPRLLSFDVNLRPTLSQLSWDFAGQNDTGRRDGLYGAGSLRILAGAPASLFLRGFRTSDTFRGAFDTRSDAEASGYTAGGRLRSPYGSLNLRYEWNESDVITTSARLAGSRRFLRRNELALTAQNSKTRVTLDRFERDEVLAGTRLLRYRALATNWQRWGKGSTLRSSFQYWDQEGTAGSKIWVWSQAVLLRHTRDVSTGLRYSLSDQRTPSDFSRGWTAGLTETVRFTRRLSVSLSGRGDSRRSSLGRTRNYLADATASLSIELPAEFRLSATTGGGYRWRDQQASEGGLATVIGERHELGPSRRFLLDELQVDPSSVRLTNEDGTIVYERQLDYQLFQSGAFLEVVALPGGRIETGQIILVDYRHALLPSANAEALRVLYSLDLGRGGIRAYHRNSLELPTDDRPIPMFNETQLMSTGIAAQARTSFGGARAGAEWARQRFEPERSDIYLAYGGLDLLLARRLLGRLDVRWSSRRNEGEYEIIEGSSHLEWTPRPRLRLFGELSGYDWRQESAGTPAAAGQFIGLGLGAEWQLGLMSIGLRYDRLAWDDRSDLAQDRLFARISRRF